jgi:diguanylate cyclase (GGDEF)-like protein
MNIKDIDTEGAEYSQHPVQIMDRIWWVGCHLENDAFQCHTYLIEHGDQSVLFDPGSTLTFTETLRKIQSIIPFDNIRYFVCHHQDPDITASLPSIDRMVTRKDAVIVTHWRAEALLKHYGLKNLPFHRVEDHQWRLELGGRLLKFVYTPYLHFPGAFTTFDTATGVLFSSDLFGGLSENWSLVANDESIFDGIRVFHEHYMPSREILVHGLSKLEVLPIKMIAPQHGSIIPAHLVEFIFNKLKGIDCGLYLLSEGETGIHRLSRMNKMLRDITETMVLYRDFEDIANAILEIAKRVLPTKALEFYAIDDDESVMQFTPETRFRGTAAQLPPEYNGIPGIDKSVWFERYVNIYHVLKLNAGGYGLIIPLISVGKDIVKSIAVFTLDDEPEITEEAFQMLRHLNVPLEVAIEREFILRKLDMERQAIYEQSIRDSLTGLFNRIYMKDMVKHFMNVHDRDEASGMSVILIDIDHFKKVNDTFGHNAGDKVLKRLASMLHKYSRGSDIPVRYGGEEFAVFLIGESARYAPQLAERLRKAIEKTDFGDITPGRSITISVGVAFRRQNESIEDFVGRADAQLYKAKGQGRNMTCVDKTFSIDALEDEPAE